MVIMASKSSCEKCSNQPLANDKSCRECGDIAGSKGSLLKVFQFLGIILVMWASIVATGNFLGIKRTDDVDDREVVRLHVGETFQASGFEITVTSIEARTVIGDSNLILKQAQDNSLFLVVSWSIRNITSSPINLSAHRPRITLFSDDLTLYQEDAVLSALLGSSLELDHKVVGGLNPLIMEKQVSVFEVSNQLYNPQTWTICIMADRIGRFTIG